MPQNSDDNNFSMYVNTQFSFLKLFQKKLSFSPLYFKLQKNCHFWNTLLYLGITNITKIKINSYQFISYTLWLL